MESRIQAAPASNATRWTGRILSTLSVLFLLFDGVIHILRIQPVVDAFAQLGFPISVAVGLGVIEIICIALYVNPSTAVFGAILLTGYLGGAIAAQIRIGSPLFSNALFPVYVGLFVWGGLYLRDAQLRALIPVRREPASAR